MKSLRRRQYFSVLSTSFSYIVKVVGARPAISPNQHHQIVEFSPFSSKMAGVLGLLGHSTPFLAGFAWFYRVGFDHILIRDYKIGNRLSKAQLNLLVDATNDRFATQIRPIDGTDRDFGATETTSDFTKSKRLTWTGFWHEMVGDSTESGASHQVVAIGFSLVMALSLELMILILCQLVDPNSENRDVLFHLTIDSLVILVTVLVPFMIINLLVSHLVSPVCKHKSDYRARVCVSVVAFLAWFWTLHKFGDLSRSFSPKSSTYQTRSLVDQKINQISIAGITVMSILSGIGAATSIYKVIPSIIALVGSRTAKYPPKPSEVVTETDLNNMILSYNNTIRLLSKRQAQLSEYEVGTGGTVYNDKLTGDKEGDLKLLKAPNRIGGILHKVQSFASLSQIQQGEEQELNEEIRALQTLSNNLFQDVNKAMIKFCNHKNQTTNHSVVNNLMVYFDYVFSGYCIYRVLNIVFVKFPYYYQTLGTQALGTSQLESKDSVADSTNDALAITISKIITSLLNVSMSESQLTNQIGFLISGSLFMVNFSNVLMTLKSFGHLFPIYTQLPGHIKNWLKHLAISQLLAIYIISTCLLIRINLPTNLSVQISKILSLSGSASTSEKLMTREIEFIDHWFDLVFCVTIAITAVVLMVQNWAQEAPEYDEELFVEEAGPKLM